MKVPSEIKGEDGSSNNGGAPVAEIDSGLMNIRRFTIARVPIDIVTHRDVIRIVDGFFQRTGGHYLAVVNASKIVIAQEDERLRQALEGADLVTADGMSVIWASKLLGYPLKERITGIDILEQLVERAAETGRSIFFLGASDESVKGTVAVLSSRYPGLRVAGYRNGYFQDKESCAVADEVRAANADLLFVGIGSPAQEYWIARHLESTGVKVALGVGGSFDHICGKVKRAPLWMQKSGLEWLHRLMVEPRRLWRRYLIGNWKFMKLITKELLRRFFGPTSHTGK